MSDLVAALAKAQAKMGPVKKGHVNPHFKSNYADLADVLAVVRPALNAEGIAVVQPIEDGELVTRLLRGDEVIESRVPLVFDVSSQQLGSQISYMRRYALCALVGVAAEDDDDGNAASEVRRPPQARPGKSGIGKATDAQIALAERIIGKLGDPTRTVEIVERFTGVRSILADLDRAAMSELLDALKEHDKNGEKISLDDPSGEPWDEADDSRPF